MNAKHGLSLDSGEFIPAEELNRRNEMTEQPEALRLAEQLETEWGDDCELEAAAAELRRLYALNAELLEALRKCSDQLTRFGYSANHADAAIAKGEQA